MSPIRTAVVTSYNYHENLNDSTEKLLQGDRGVNPSNLNAIAGSFKEETVYFTKAVEDLKTRHQWRMVMKDVIMQDVVVTPSLHGTDPTAAIAKDDDNKTQSSGINNELKNGNMAENIPCNNENDENDAKNKIDVDDDNDCTIVSVSDRSQLGPMREPIPPHKVVTRKRGDQEVKLDLYGAWQTEPYTVSVCARVRCE